MGREGLSKIGMIEEVLRIVRLGEDLGLAEQYWDDRGSAEDS